MSARRPFSDCALLEACFRGRVQTVRWLLQRRAKPNLTVGWHGLILGWCGGVWVDLAADAAGAESALRAIVFDLLGAGLRVETPTEDAEVTAVVAEWNAQRLVA